MRIARVFAGVALAAGTLLPAPPAEAAATPVSSCPFFAQTSVIVTQDLTCNGSDGIIAQAEGITIDLGGHVLRSDKTTDHDGIVNTTLGGFQKVDVRNGVLRNFDTGIFAGALAHDMTVNNVVVSGNAGYGIDIEGEDAAIESVAATGNGLTGINIDGGSASLKSVVASGNVVRGISMIGDSAALKSVTTTGNGNDGIDITGDDAVLSSVNASGNASDGIDLTGDSASIKSSRANGNGLDGVIVTGDSAAIQSVIATGNVDHGIHVIGAFANVRKSTVSGNDLVPGGTALLINGNAPSIAGNRVEANGFPAGASDGSGLGLRLMNTTTPPKGTSIVRGNDGAVQCIPTNVC